MIKILSRSKWGKRQLCSWRKPSSKKTSSLQIPALPYPSSLQNPAPGPAQVQLGSSPEPSCDVQLVRSAAAVRWSAGLVKGGLTPGMVATFAPWVCQGALSWARAKQHSPIHQKAHSGWWRRRSLPRCTTISGGEGDGQSQKASRISGGRFS